VGPSGAGKSSFVRAGLIPALQRSGEGWEAFILRPGREPMAALVGVLLQISPRSTSALADRSASLGDSRSRDELLEVLRTQPGYLGVKLRARAQHKVRRVLLFVDQFEELYTLCADPDERGAFVACLEAAADDATSPLRVILTLRSDFLDRVADDRERMHEVIRGVVVLPAMGRADLRDALVRPVEQAGHRYETAGMVDTMLDELHDTQCPLPLLQFAAAQLWQRRDRQARLLSQASYDQLGGVAGALARHADTVLAGFSSREQALVRALFLRLVTPEHTRAIVSLAELREIGQDAGAVEQVVQQLASARLLIIETGDDDAAGQDAADQMLIELSHESLIERWPRLTRWLDEDQEAAQFRARMQAAAREWHRQGRTDDLLWRGRAAQQAQTWLDRHPAQRADERPPGDSRQTQISADERQYVRAVVDLAARARRRRRFIAVFSFALLSAVAVLVSLLALR
ncbi:MAG: protein kinase, partial [Myxococcota bacterium]